MSSKINHLDQLRVFTRLFKGLAAAKLTKRACSILPRFKNRLRGFTLIEILIVVTVIGILSGAIYVATPAIMVRARDARIVQDFHQLLNLAEKINLDDKNYNNLCLGSSPCNEDLQQIDEDIIKRKGTLVIQKQTPFAQSYCAFSPLNSPTEEGETQYYCIDNAGGKIKIPFNPGINYCNNVSFKCPTETELAEGDDGGEIVVLPPTTGLHLFRVSTQKYPRFIEATIDPLDVSVGEIQSMIIEIEDPDEISWIRADIEHDNGWDAVMLTLTRGDLARGTWYGQWLVYDTHKETYRTTFIAQNRKGEQSSITLTWTDPCSFPYSGDVNVEDFGQACQIQTSDPDGGVNGPDNGNLTISTYDLTIGPGATLAFNPGKSIIFTGSGSIIIDKTAPGGQIKKANIWMVDGDVDGYSGALTQYYEEPVDGRRRYEMSSSTLDYDDSNASIYPGTTCDGTCTKNMTNGTCGTAANNEDPGDNCLAQGCSTGLCKGTEAACSESTYIAINCSVTTGSCANTTIFKLSATDNAHAELAAQSNYNYYVCCSGGGVIGNSCSGNYDTSLKLSDTSNAHSEKKTELNYGNSACLSATYGTVTCDYASNCSSLGAAYSCLGSISGDTNSQAGDCSAYTTKICCANTCP